MGGRRSNYLRFSHVSQYVREQLLTESMPGCSSDVLIGSAAATNNRSLARTVSYKANSDWRPELTFAASSFTSSSSDLNSHFSSSVTRAG